MPGVGHSARSEGHRNRGSMTMCMLIASTGAFVMVSIVLNNDLFEVSSIKHISPLRKREVGFVRSQMGFKSRVMNDSLASERAPAAQGVQAGKSFEKEFLVAVTAQGPGKGLGGGEGEVRDVIARFLKHPDRRESEIGEVLNAMVPNAPRIVGEEMKKQHVKIERESALGGGVAGLNVQQGNTAETKQRQGIRAEEETGEGDAQGEEEGRSSTKEGQRGVEELGMKQGFRNYLLGHGEVLREGKKGRWRDNNYVMEAGILPYQRCMSGDFAPGPAPQFGVFAFDKIRYDLALLGTTVWGASDETGKPTEVKVVQLLMYYQYKDKPCDSVHYSKHCYLPPIYPRVQCRVGDGAIQWVEAFRNVRQVTIQNSSEEERQNIPVDPVYCPFAKGMAALTDTFSVQVRVGDDNLRGDSEATMTIEMCYEHVPEAAVVTVCTQPQFGFSKRSGYWQGSPKYKDYNLMDSFLLYHLDLMNASVSVYDTESSLKDAIEPYRSTGRVKYRPNWGLYEMQKKPKPGEHYNPYGYQTQAEIACFWEQRFRAKWVLFLHSADCYVLPGNAEDTLVTILEGKVDSKAVSEIRIPTVEAHSPRSSNVSENIVLRFPLHGRGGLVKQKRFTPLGNPRDYDAANVHVFTGNRTTVKGRLGTRECVFDLKLRTIHVFAAARENADRHSGRTEPQWELLGWKLEELLAKDLPRRATSRDKIFQDV